VLPARGGGDGEDAPRVKGVVGFADGERVHLLVNKFH
jgi:hypothetical protein